MRAHLYKTITEIHGEVQYGTVVRVLQPDSDPESAVPVIDPIFAAKTGTDEKGTTFTVTDGIIDVWMDVPQYVMLGLTPPNQLEFFIDNVEVFQMAGAPIGHAASHSTGGTDVLSPGALGAATVASVTAVADRATVLEAAGGGSDSGWLLVPDYDPAVMVNVMSTTGVFARNIDGLITLHNAFWKPTSGFTWGGGQYLILGVLPVGCRPNSGTTAIEVPFVVGNTIKWVYRGWISSNGNIGVINEGSGLVLATSYLFVPTITTFRDDTPIEV